jgi:catechol 2,3-dioxygenase-like lactoylglutathione lyase family enzyme
VSGGPERGDARDHPQPDGRRHGALAFYRDGIGLGLVVGVSPDRRTLTATDSHDAAFVILSSVDGGELMLQTTASLREEHPTLATIPAFTGTVYIRGMDPRPILPRLPAEAIVAPPTRRWYGMLEAYVRDPDGYLVCLGIADGAAEPTAVRTE